jgi:hypothetical protein
MRRIPHPNQLVPFFVKHERMRALTSYKSEPRAHFTKIGSKPRVICTSPHMSNKLPAVQERKKRYHSV